MLVADDPTRLVMHMLEGLGYKIAGACDSTDDRPSVKFVHNIVAKWHSRMAQ